MEINEERDLTTKFKTKMLDKITFMPISPSNVPDNLAKNIYIEKSKKCNF